MHTTLTNVNRDFSPDNNYWELNPQIPFIKPFDELHAIDDGGELSSKYMWAVFFMCDPDEEINRMFRFKPAERKEAVLRYFPEINWDLREFENAMESYPFECLNSIQRALKAELDSLKDRDRLIRNTPRTIDHYMKDNMDKMILDKSGKPIFVKGTASQLDAMHSKTSKIYENLEGVLEKFMFSKKDEARLFGGRHKTISEQGLL